VGSWHGQRAVGSGQLADDSLQTAYRKLPTFLT